MIFWIGDLNYRLDKLENLEIKNLIEKKKYSELLKYDQV